MKNRPYLGVEISEAMEGIFFDFLTKILKYSALPSFMSYSGPKIGWCPGLSVENLAKTNVHIVI
jgi:hypothetical protein